MLSECFGWGELVKNGTLGLVMVGCRCGCECISARLKVLQFLKAKARGKPGYEGAEEESLSARQPSPLNRTSNLTCSAKWKRKAPWFKLVSISRQLQQNIKAKAGFCKPPVTVTQETSPGYRWRCRHFIECLLLGIFAGKGWKVFCPLFKEGVWCMRSSVFGAAHEWEWDALENKMFAEHTLVTNSIESNKWWLQHLKEL